MEAYAISGAEASSSGAKMHCKNTRVNVPLSTLTAYPSP
jgi:hypothetical protein